MFEAYELNSRPKGSVLIVNNETFNTTELERREGSDKDYHLLKTIFRDFGFKVKTYYNLDSHTFMKVVKDFAKSHENWKLDSAILFVMTHGHKDKENPRAVDLAMTDNRYISSDWIREKFSNRSCKALVNKPKIFFFQACRDNSDFTGKVHRPEHRPSNDDVDPLINDLLVVYACLPGYGAHRNSRHGSWFIQELCSAIRSDGNLTHIYEILNKVDMSLRERFIREKGNCYQGIYFENWSFNRMFFLSKNAQNIHKTARVCVILSPLLGKGDRSRERKKPSPSKPILLPKEANIPKMRKDRDIRELCPRSMIKAIESLQG